MRRLQRLQHASYPPRSLPPWWCAQDQTMRRPWTHRHHAHLPAYSGVPSPGKETPPHAGKLRGGGTRGAGSVLVMNIARRGQARSWRTCRRPKTAVRRAIPSPWCPWLSILLVTDLRCPAIDLIRREACESSFSRLLSWSNPSETPIGSACSHRGWSNFSLLPSCDPISSSRSSSSLSR